MCTIKHDAIVFRVASEYNVWRGMYNASCSSELRANEHDARRPTPDKDDIELFDLHTYKHYFGFISIEQLKQWMINHRTVEELERDNCVVFELRVKCAYVTHHQAIFELDKHVETIAQHKLPIACADLS